MFQKQALSIALYFNIVQKEQNDDNTLSQSKSTLSLINKYLPTSKYLRIYWNLLHVLDYVQYTNALLIKPILTTSYTC